MPIFALFYTNAVSEREHIQIKCKTESEAKAQFKEMETQILFAKHPTPMMNKEVYCIETINGEPI
jgi:hypothetical protein